MTTNEEYLKMLESLKQDFDYWHPELVIYNAGTDVLAEDPLGQLSMLK
jgi:acetoin utilization deacetylase AcuC-like enzyme